MLSAIERDVDKDIADFHPEDRNTFFLAVTAGKNLSRLVGLVISLHIAT
jgi:hypothetical protein